MRYWWFFVLILLLAAPARPAAQDLEVPEAALLLLDVSVDRGRALAMSRAIRILHSAPRVNDNVPPAVFELERLLADLDRLEAEVARVGARGFSLEMAKTSTGRDALRDILAASGLRLRERRGLYTVESEDGRDDAEVRERLRQTGIDTTTVMARLNAGETVTIAPTVAAFPLPLPPDAWAGAVFERPLTPRTLFGAIIRDRRASLLYYGIQAMTPETRALLAKNPELVRSLYREAAAAVGAFGAAFRVDAGGAAIVPGGPDAVELWEPLVDARVAQPGRFALALFGRDGGRLAYFVDALSQLDEPHLKFALGMWIADRGIRAQRFRSIYQAFVSIDPEWRVDDTPFARPPYDAARMLATVEVTPQGTPTSPAFRTLWARAFDSLDIPAATARDIREPAGDGLIDAEFLVARLAGQLPPARRAMIERLAFGQRLFATVQPAELQDVLTALRAYGRYPAAMMALERIGIGSPALYAQVARHALTIERIEDPARSVPTLAQFQGALALLDRLARTGAVSLQVLEQLVASLSALPVRDGRYEGRLAAWIDDVFLRALPEAPAPGGSAEDRVLDALADRDNRDAPFDWEGERYAVNFAVARGALTDVRARQRGNRLDQVLALFSHARALVRETHTLDQIKARAAALRAAAAMLAPARPWPDAPDDVPDVRRIVERAVRDLTRITRARDAGRAARIGAPLLEIVDYLLGETLVAIAYAPAVGDPAGLVGSTADLSHRHAFGVSPRAGVLDNSRLAAWRRPKPGSDTAEGAALNGSILGVDLGLSRRQLRRLAADQLPEAPRLNANDRRTMTDTVALLNPRELTDAGAEFIRASMRRGDDRLVMAGSDPEALDRLAGEAQVPGSRRQLLPWTAQHEPEHVRDLFSVAEVFWLGAGDAPDLRPWGVAHEPLIGCYCLRLPPRGSWEMLGGRPGTGQVGAAVADLNLRVAALLAELRVPPALFPGVMAMATQDYVDSVPAVHEDDWLAIAGRAWDVSQERVEDYVSALVANGPVTPRAESGSAPESGSTR